MTILTRAAKGSELTYNEMDANLIDTRDALAAPSGSGLVGHIASGAGAVATTVQSKLRVTKLVWDYLSPAERTDVESNTLALDHSASLQVAINTGYDLDFSGFNFNANNLTQSANEQRLFSSSGISKINKNANGCLTS